MGNPLNANSVNVHVPQLEERGVQVLFRQEELMEALINREINGNQ